MFYLFISFISFILLSKSFPYKQLIPLECKIKLLSSFLVSWFQKSRIALSFFQFFIKFSMPLMNVKCSLRAKSVEEEELEGTSLLDLPELPLESILERLSPFELCKMAAVCNCLRDVCDNDHFWEKHMKKKWGLLIGNSAYYKEWLLNFDLSPRRRKSNPLIPCRKKSSFNSFFSRISFLLGTKTKLGSKNYKSSLPVDSMKAWYLAVESGKLWFPAQVYNRESGHVGFMLSCYDAQVRYCSRTDSFKARYLHQGPRVVEENIQWNRLRSPPVDTPPNVLHVTNCLTDLEPGDHIEIQWRKSKEFSFGWWYGVIGHSEECEGNLNNCHCNYNDMVTLEFSQYGVGSQWRKTMINRKSHKEEGNEENGYYGGIRKLYREEEIIRWKHLWPNRFLA